jgi:AcrR family transcriptional regulator
LVDIARAADVPPGNVYYYFKTRDDLVAAVVADRVAGIRGLLEALDSIPNPAARLKALANVWADNANDISTYGCPMGTLCSELNKQPRTDHGAAEIFSMSGEWIAIQFRELGQPDEPELAMTMLSAVQGAAVLASTLRDPTILTSQIHRLERWIDSLTPPPSPATNTTRARARPNKGAHK